MSGPRMAIVVFARMSSSRLPGKVLMDFGGRPLLAHIVARAQALELPVIVATSTRPEDAAVAAAAERCGAIAWRGSLDNVLQRAVDCAQAHGLEAFARLCGDRPYFPVQQMRDGLAQMHAAMVAGRALDLATNHLPENPPPGLSTEVVRVAALQRVLAREPSERHREHLTSGLYDDAPSYQMVPIACDFAETRGHRFAVDTLDDYRRLGGVAHQLGDVSAGPEAVARHMDEDGRATGAA